MADIPLGTAETASLRDAYLAEMRRKRLYGGLMLVVFVALFVSALILADSRNAGGFRDGIRQIFDFPAEVLTEAAAKAAN
ncbi:MAG: phosphonate ABC transporter, permease protein PhnE, partial [Alphaproteobacteria bacterium HGW-Alphaproteobacteria-2]